MIANALAPSKAAPSVQMTAPKNISNQLWAGVGFHAFNSSMTGTVRLVGARLKDALLPRLGRPALLGGRPRRVGAACAHPMIDGHNGTAPDRHYQEDGD
jgi:hypothetical protein